MASHLSDQDLPHGMLANHSKQFTFALVPKLTNEPHFDTAAEGCKAMAAELGNVVCEYVGIPEADPIAQAELIVSLIGQDIDGISVAVLDEEITGAAIRKVMDAGIPVVTFDSDAASSGRLAYIGTDNYAFGSELGKVLLQLRPEGGEFGSITGNGPNLFTRLQGLRDRLEGSDWIEAAESPKNCHSNNTLSIVQMSEFGENPRIAAIVPVGGWPMFDQNTTSYMAYVDANPGITNVCADAAPVQLELMAKGYADGLVGQEPYVMGEQSMKTLLDIKTGMVPEDQVLGTHLLEVLRVPLMLPELEVDENNLENLAILGYTFVALISFFSLVFGYWSGVKRKARVVRASQPVFLIMICVGTFIMGLSIVPLSIDTKSHSQAACDTACMAFPWLLSIGFTTTFSALFIKTWRVVQIFCNPNRFKKIVVKEKDVIIPYLALLLSNIVVLLCWTLISPLRMVRMAHAGTDDWNRTISTYSYCSSDNMVVFLAILGVINIGVLVVANIMAYKARTVQTEFSESRYIMMIMACVLQACLIGIPIIYFVSDQPQARYVIMAVLISVICGSVLSLIFIPKILFHRQRERELKTKNERSISDNSHGMNFEILHSTKVTDNPEKKLGLVKRYISEMSEEGKLALVRDMDIKTDDVERSYNRENLVLVSAG